MQELTLEVLASGACPSFLRIKDIDILDIVSLPHVMNAVWQRNGNDIAESNDFYEFDITKLFV